MAKIIDDIKKQIAESEGFPVEKIDEFVAFINDDPYITSAGLQYKMLSTYKAGKFAVQSVIPSNEEYALLRRMMGLKDDEPLVVMRGEVWVEGFERPFVDYGTTTPKNLRGFVRFSDYPLEMATRRATNRAMRLATATGLCSIDEVKEPATDGNPEGEAGEDATQGQVDLIRNLSRNSMFTEEERARIDSQIADGLAKRQASELIDRIKTKLDARKKNTNGKHQQPAPNNDEPPPPTDDNAPPTFDELFEGDAEEAPPPEPKQAEPDQKAAYDEFLQKCQKATELLGVEKVTEILNRFGVSRPNEIPPGDVNVRFVLECLREAYVLHTKAENTSITRPIFLERCQNFKKWIGETNFNQVLIIHDLPTEDAIPEDDKATMLAVLETLESENKKATTRDDDVRTLAGKNWPKAHKYLQKQYGVKTAEHLTPEECEEFKEWIAEQTTQQAAT